MGKAIIEQHPQVRSEVSMIGPEVAKHFLQTTQFPRQRTLNEPNIMRLVSEMLRGWFIPGTSLFFAVLPDGTTYQLNGQHSLNAIVRSKTTYPFTLTYVEVADINQAGHMYSRLDLQRTRSWHDAYRAAGFEDKATFDVTWVSTFGTAIRSLLNNFKYDADRAQRVFLSSRELQLQIFEEYLPLAEKYVRAMRYKHGKAALPWKRGVVMAIGLELMQYQPKKAYDFFYGASADDGLAASDPRKVLLTYLRNNGALARHERKLIAAATAMCWNAYFGGQSMKVVYPSSERAIVLDGTPWNGHYEPFKKLTDSLKIMHGEAASYTMMTTGHRLEKTGLSTPITHYVSAETALVGAASEQKALAAPAKPEPAKAPAKTLKLTKKVSA